MPDKEISLKPGRLPSNRNRPMMVKNGSRPAIAMPAAAAARERARGRAPSAGACGLTGGDERSARLLREREYGMWPISSTPAPLAEIGGHASARCLKNASAMVGPDVLKPLSRAHLAGNSIGAWRAGNGSSPASTASRGRFGASFRWPRRAPAAP